MTESPHLSDIEYRPVEDAITGFTLDTGLQYDYACFAIWNGAFQKQEEILEDIQNHFEILANYEVYWSKQFYRQNIDRLYERPMRDDEGFEGWDRKIGPPPFRFLIVRDTHPKYTWKRSVSGVIEPSNETVVETKYRYRGFFRKKYQVHSSNNIEEFLFQSALVLGAERLHAALKAPSLETQVLHKDLEGAGGWKDWRQLFEVLSIGSRYLVQRNFEGLPEQLMDGDIDFLSDNFQRLASLCGINQKPAQRYKGSMKIDGKAISVDIRFIGDKYFPDAWQVDMLRRRQLRDGFFTPAPDDLFFSVLYHCKAQKQQVKSKYVSELASLARDLKFDWFDGVDVRDDAACAEILNGYMRARGYYYELPLDRGVQKNKAVIDRLPSATAGVRVRSFRDKVLLAIRHPRKVREVISRNVTRLANKFSGR